MRRSLGVVALAGCLAMGALSGAPATARPGSGQGQTSDGLPGQIARPRPAYALPPVVHDDVSWQVAPGLMFRQWEEMDARGTIQAYLLTASLDEPTLRLRYVDARYVRQRAPLTRLLALNDAVAGINGDFFDIHDTGAPLGIGVDRRRFLHGPVGQPNVAFVIDAAGQPHVEHVDVEGSLPGHPGIHVTGVNSPYVKKQGVGAFTSRWGRTAGYGVLDKVRKHVREVVVRGGRVVSNRKVLSDGRRVRGLMLVGRGHGADSLAPLKVGRRVRLRTSVVGDPRLVLSSNAVLLHNGQVMVTDDVMLHPRSAIGIDQDGRQLFLLVIDGRSESSSGYTMVELADMMLQLGAADALNLDGGGSSTIVARGLDGLVAVRNHPSDGMPRSIPNGLGFVSTAP
jgi:hypothetical protein